MRRRRFAVLLGGTAATWSLAVHAQQQKTMATIGYLSIASSTDNATFYESFLAGLRDLGYVDGRTIRIEARFADGNNDRLVSQAAELVGRNVDLIVTYAGAGVFAARKATTTVPIVVAVGPDLVSLGLAASFARPGGNITGLRYLAGESFAKRQELLKEIDPSITQVGVLLPRGSSFNVSTLESLKAGAEALKLELRPLEASGPTDYTAAFAAWADGKVTGLVVHDNPQFVADAKVIAALAVQHRLRSIGSLEHTANGGLMAYSVDFVELLRRSASFVDKILKGTKAGDLPIEQPTRFRFVINLATAKLFGLAIPAALLARADEVIE
jgi:putative tryptophan/tyrosine transport system substrate-binding protein